MDHYFVLGNPIEHSQSPLIHARFAELTGQAMRYDKQCVALDGLQAMLTKLARPGVDRLGGKDDVKGCNVTVPFKFEAFQASHTATARAQLAQAANTLVFTERGLHADNTDGVGLVNDIEINAGVPLAGKSVLLIGAGGAAAGVLGPLLMAGPARLVVTNRTLAKAQALVARHENHPVLAHLLLKTDLEVHETRQLQPGFDIVINATASSLSGSSIPVGHHVLKPGALAYDMMYGTAAQSFLQWASLHGAVARDGLGMLVEQAGEAFKLWRGVPAPTAQVLGEMRARLAAASA